jgi:hypothetical protein
MRKTRLFNRKPEFTCGQDELSIEKLFEPFGIEGYTKAAITGHVWEIKELVA